MCEFLKIKSIAKHTGKQKNGLVLFPIQMVSLIVNNHFIAFHLMELYII